MQDKKRHKTKPRVRTAWNIRPDQVIGLNDLSVRLDTSKSALVRQAIDDLLRIHAGETAGQ